MREVRQSLKPYFFSHKIVLILLGCFITLRFIFPFISNPVDHLFADSAHHWNAGKHLLNPTVMDALNPKLYQFYIFILRFISGDTPFIIAFFTGVLCASLPYLWYKAARECMTKTPALLLALLIATCPSLWTIYAYFMNETLLLNLMALATWLSLRAIRKHTFRSAIVAIFIWILAIHTRSVALPFAIFFTSWILYTHSARWKLLTASALMTLAIAIPAGLHSYSTLHIFAPLGYNGLIELYRKSGAQSVAFTTTDGQSSPQTHFFVGSAAVGVSPLYPLDYHTYRTPTPYKWTIDLTQGKRDWQHALDTLDYSFTDYVRETQENILFFFLGHSWPEIAVPSWSIRQTMSNKVMTIPPFLYGYHLHYRYIWTLCLIILVAHIMKEQPRITKSITIFTLLCCAGLILQDIGPTNGRFRKPLEPYILLCTVMALHTRYQQKYRQLKPTDLPKP